MAARTSDGRGWKAGDERSRILESEKVSSDLRKAMSFACVGLAPLLVALIGVQAPLVVLLSGPLFLAIGLGGAVVRTSSRPGELAGIAIGVSLGFASTWAGMAWCQTRYSELSTQEKQVWEQRHRLRDTGPSGACSLSGFPFRVVQGRDHNSFWVQQGWFVVDRRFGAPLEIPVHRGLWGIWLNFATLSVAWWLLARLVPKRAMLASHLVAFTAAAGSTMLARSWLVANAW